MPFYAEKKPQVLIGSTPSIPLVHGAIPTVVTTTTNTPSGKTIYSSSYSYSAAPVVSSPKVISTQNDYKYSTTTSKVTANTIPAKRAAEYRTYEPSGGFFYEPMMPLNSTMNNIYEVSPEEEECNKITYHPRVELYSTSSFVIIMMDLPGMAKENLNVELEKGLLKIFGKKEKPDIEELNDEKEFHTKIVERLNEYYFCKVYQMPPTFSEGHNISCKLKDGELIIKIRAKEVKEVKKVINVE